MNKTQTLSASRAGLGSAIATGMPKLFASVYMLPSSVAFSEGAADNNIALAATEASDAVIINGFMATTTVLAASENPDAANINGVVLSVVFGAMAATEFRDSAVFSGVRVQRPPAKAIVKPPQHSEAPDIRLVQNTQFPKYSVTVDWQLLSDGTLDDTQSLATAIVVALGTDRLAEPGDILPDLDSTDRRGWWGDFDAQPIWDGWPIGSRLWLLTRDKIVGPGARQGATTVRVEQYIREAIRPFLDRRVGSTMEVKASRIGPHRIDALVRIYRGPLLEIELRYQVLWKDIIAQGGGYDIGQVVNPF